MTCNKIVELDGSTPSGVKAPINRGSRNAATSLTLAGANPLDDASLSTARVPSADSTCEVVIGRPSLPPNHEVMTLPESSAAEPIHELGGPAGPFSGHQAQESRDDP